MGTIIVIVNVLLNIICFFAFFGGILCWILAFFGTTGLYSRRECQSLMAVGTACFVVVFIGNALLNLI
jgi:hypothetical protein